LPPNATLFPYPTLFRSRQADQIERGAADQGAFVGRFDWVQATLFQFCQDEVINGRSRPRGVSDLRQWRVLDRPERPELTRLGEVDRKSTRLNSSHVSIS